MIRKLTPKSTLENFKREAKRWLVALRANVGEARARLERAFPAAPTNPALRDVQHALAREHGVEGWAALKDQLAADAFDNSQRAERVALFLQNASLDWRVGGPERTMARHAAVRLLNRDPEIAHDSIYTAVVCGDLDEVNRLIAERPEVASEKGGPRDWPPLLYLCSTRLPYPAVSDNAVAIARALLDNGADPNVYYPGGNDSIHYTALTCVAGEGEEDGPPHPQRRALWQLLLERGAEPYDNQTLYNTHFHGDVLWYLELMYAQSVKLGRQSDWEDPDWPMLDMGGYGPGAYYLLNISLGKNDLQLAEWLLAHGANAGTAKSSHRKFRPKRTLYEEAVALGNSEFAELLVRYGAAPRVSAMQGEEAFVAACFRGDRAEAQRLATQHPEYLTSPMAMFGAAHRDRADVVALLVDLGVSPNIADPKGGMQRALHVAAYADAPRAAAALLERGAAIDPVEFHHKGTPLWFAVWGQKPHTIELLSPFSRDLWALTFTGNVERVREVLSADPQLARMIGKETTPLMWLPEDEARAIEIVELLLAHGADPTIKNREGLTAADLASKRGLYNVARLLRPRGH
ncbi:MAG: ankyrin repeat domain-containing protein [Gemmatimonadaceae bacterium]